MKKIIATEMVTLDGNFGGLNGEVNSNQGSSKFNYSLSIDNHSSLINHGSV